VLETEQPPDTATLLRMCSGWHSRGSPGAHSGWHGHVVRARAVGAACKAAACAAWLMPTKLLFTMQSRVTKLDLPSKGSLAGVYQACKDLDLEKR